ncbi:DUF1127 domain-containing protein [Paracoccus sp. M683]|uniref:DUF1127 domain-containing protein n=1 Tax=Paracoccus sp. M683 TaxID=2594268 RepID=UPI0011801FB5|nr:DUF1127 domain-containing protein [Paracoccus sp. M683]TRW99481.1 DUF1127 domain-containing protein [Paracoccus sp. M683]
MTAIATNNGAAIETLFTEIAARFRSWNARRRTRGELNQLSERQLEDIGMCRADIDTVVSAL